MKSLAVVALAVGTAAIAIAGGALEPERFVHLSGASAFAIGLFASVGGTLVGWSARPEIESRIAVAVRRGRPALVMEPARGTVRELPGPIQRLVLVAVFACLAIATFTNEATARIAAVPDKLAEPSRAEYCHDEEEAAAPEPAPVIEAPPVDQAGCALVKRAFELGYAKSLGSCAPKAIAIPRAAQPKAPREVCTRRQRDEPFVHYAWRRMVETASGASPVDAASERAETFRTRLDFARDLLADIKHSITGTPHASHHLWVDLPDPHPGSWRDHMTGAEPCTSLFEHLPLWPAWTTATPPSTVVEHVLGQLLFATRFGTPASCSDYTIHWGAPPDACTRLAADPVAFLDDSGALAPIRAVLDRRSRQLALRRLADALGHAQTLPVPPPARAVVSVGCLIVDPAAPPARTVAARELALDGEPIALRELRVPEVRPTGAGPIDTFVSLALLLGGTPYAGPARASADRVTAEPVGDLADPSYPLVRLEPLVDADPFVERTANRPYPALDRPDLAEVFPYEHHLFGFVDAFRRVYLPQRGRL